MADAGTDRLDRFLTFLVGNEQYALPAAEVSEIVTLPRLARLPQSPKALLGMANLRGAAVPVASCRALLGQAGEAEAAGTVILLAGEAPVALVVDAVERIVTVAAQTIETSAAAMAARPGERLRGAFASGTGRSAKILDLMPMLQAAFTAPTTHAGPGRRETRPAEPMPGTMPATNEAQRLLVSFTVAAQLYALPLEEVQEIIAPPPGMLAVAQSDPVVLGIIAFRTGLLPVLSLRGLLGLPAAALGWQAKIIVIRVADMLAGLLADQAEAILHAGPAELQPAPPLLAARAGGESCIAAIYRDKSGRRLAAVLEAARLFKNDVMQRLDKAVTAPAPPAVPEGETMQQFLVFRLGEEEFGLPVAAVDEVAGLPERITYLPKTPKFLEGVINLRGEVLPVIDQRRRFGMPPFGGEAARRRLVVLRSARHRAGLIVDDVSGVLAAPDSAIAPAPDLTGEPERLVPAVLNLPESGRMVLLLNQDELLSRAEQKLLDRFAAAHP